MEDDLVASSVLAWLHSMCVCDCILRFAIISFVERFWVIVIFFFYIHIDIPLCVLLMYCDDESIK